MKPQDQTVTIEKDGWGDCLRASIASVLDRDVESLPTFDREIPKALRWLNEQGYEHDLAPFLDGLPAGLGYVVVCGVTPRGSHHACVGKVVGGGAAFEVAHDPHPSRAGLATIDTIIAIWPKAAA